jgi:UDP-N-acetylmuramoyl-L-alanyl-D-glutamate--2,6-diaminopimelate ligase
MHHPVSPHTKKFFLLIETVFPVNTKTYDLFFEKSWKTSGKLVKYPIVAYNDTSAKIVKGNGMAYLKQLLKNCNYMCLQGSIERKVTDICYDSAKVKKGSMFVCLPGQYRDGHDYIPEAVQRGAAICLVQKSVVVPEGVTVIRVQNTRATLAVIAADYYGRPAKKLHIIGITGTKGKTSTAYMVWHILREAGYRVGLIGTLGLQMEESCTPFYNTTPESLVIQHCLRKMVDEGYEYCVMEVSSQGLKNHRVDEIVFDIGVFTNISPDHIGPGEHADFAEYLKCKSRIFEKSRVGIVNMDDKFARKAALRCGGRVRSYGIHMQADYQASDIRYTRFIDCLGMNYHLKGAEVCNIEVGMPGIYNVYNSLAAIAVCHTIGMPVGAFSKALRGIRIRGRIEEIPMPGEYRLLIDYAHNAVSLENLLSTLRFYKPGRIVTLFGCGGNRSKLRRFQMGEVAGKLSDFTILTSDNPRFENPEDILTDIETGMKKTQGSYIRITDRKEAIAYAIEHAKKDDLIVLAGKGHEDYQEINGKLYPMDERDIIDEIVRQYHS